MKHKKYNNPMEQDILQIKLDKALEEINELKMTKSNNKFILVNVMKERDRATLATKYLTHLFIIMDTLNTILADDPTLGFVMKNAILEFKAKLNKGMLGIKYNNKNLWFEGDYDDDEADDDETN